MTGKHNSNEDTAEAGFIRARRLGKTVTGGREMTPETVQGVLRVLRGSRERRTANLSIPVAALEALGVASVDELELLVGDGELTLRPRRRA